MPLNKETTINVNDLSYEIRNDGPRVGEPSLSFKLSKSDQNAKEIGTIEGTMINYNWKRKVQSGFSRVLVYGSEPFADQHIDGLESFDSVISPRFIDFRISGPYRQPSRTVSNMLDTIEVVVDLDDYDRDAMEYYTSRIGNVSYIFDFDGVHLEDKVEEFRREWNIYDSDIYLRPVGEKPETVIPRLQKAEKVAKTHQWNISPRLDVLKMLI